MEMEIREEMCVRTQQGVGGMNGGSNRETYARPCVDREPAGVCWMTQGTHTGAL